MSNTAASRGSVSSQGATSVQANSEAASATSTSVHLEQNGNLGYVVASPNPSPQTKKPLRKARDRRVWPISWNSGTKHGRVDDSAALSAEKRAFLIESTGRSFTLHDDHKLEAAFYSNFLSREARSIPEHLLSTATGDKQPDAATVKSLKIMTMIAKNLKDNSYLTVDETIHQAVENSLLLRECNDPGNAQDAARQIIFAALGRITMFYNVQFSSKGQDLGSFGLDAGQFSFFPLLLRADEKAGRPMFETFNLFQDLLPTKPEDKQKRGPRPVFDVSANRPASDALHVSCLNAAILVDLVGVEIQWTKCVPSHLEYDPVTRKLNVFALPSFLRMHNSEAGILTRTLNDYYTGRSPPNNYSPTKFVLEILLSYKLLFNDESRARKIWKRTERKKAALTTGGEVDPLLERLCGEVTSSRTRTLRLSYSMEADFPIFGERLNVLQEDILRQHANRISALWHDRRDMLRWYTFWVVLGLGIFGLVLGIIQCVLSGFQTAYTIKAYKP